MVMGSCVLSGPLNKRKVNAFFLLSLSVVLSEKLRSSVLFVDSMEVTGAKAHSRYCVVSSVCINVEDLSLADRFSLIDESKDIVPARQLFSLPPQRDFCLTSPGIKGGKKLSTCSLSL